jgi:hypothetical protein
MMGRKGFSFPVKPHMFGIGGMILSGLIAAF